MKPIHPFPARMASELIQSAISKLPPESLIIDPMCGSGTVLRYAVEQGLNCVGYDMDPLAVLMAQAWTKASDLHQLIQDANYIVDKAASYLGDDLELPWKSEKTRKFAHYWFAPNQFEDLVRLSQALRRTRLSNRPILQICFSRLIVTKDQGASLARDVSHSRPHRVRMQNDFNVMSEFVKAARLVASRHSPDQIKGTATICVKDARILDDVDSYDLAITSPPYLNAIDYMRGHRLSLIWLGYDLDYLRTIRSNSVGAERGHPHPTLDVNRFIDRTSESRVGSRQVGWFQRFAVDIEAILQRLVQAVRSGGKIIIIIGNSLILGAKFDNVGVVTELGRKVGLTLNSRHEREILPSRRYLPPPEGNSALSLRMRTEAVLEFAVP